jgi:hypothetical protein
MPLSKKQRQEMDEKRVTLYFDEKTRQDLQDLSDELGVPRSQIMAYFFLAGMNNFAQARALLPRYLVPSKAARWQFNIDLERFREDLGG